MKVARSLLPFLTIASLFIITGIVLVLITDKYQLHLAVNAQTGGTADQFFANYTHIGDGIVVPIIIILACIIRRKNLVANLTLGITTFALSGLLAQFFKRIVFSDYFRPSKVLEGQLKLIDGVDLHSAHTFPSGHATVSFAMFIFLAFLFHRHRWIQVLLANMAVLAAYSRVYLSQHFIEDIVAGSFLGVACFFLFRWVYDTYIFKGKLQIEKSEESYFS